MKQHALPSSAIGANIPTETRSARSEEILVVGLRAAPQLLATGIRQQQHTWHVGTGSERLLYRTPSHSETAEYGSMYVLSLAVSSEEGSSLTSDAEILPKWQEVARNRNA